jgi:hypothetical protein
LAGVEGWRSRTITDISKCSRWKLAISNTLRRAWQELQVDDAADWLKQTF